MLLPRISQEAKQAIQTKFENTVLEARVVRLEETVLEARVVRLEILYGIKS